MESPGNDRPHLMEQIGPRNRNIKVIELRSFHPCQEKPLFFFFFFLLFLFFKQFAQPAQFLLQLFPP